jgi:hypothetical protein
VSLYYLERCYILIRTFPHIGTEIRHSPREFRYRIISTSNLWFSTCTCDAATLLSRQKTSEAGVSPTMHGFWSILLSQNGSCGNLKILNFGCQRFAQRRVKEFNMRKNRWSNTSIVVVIGNEDIHLKDKRSTAAPAFDRTCHVSLQHIPDSAFYCQEATNRTLSFSGP